MSRKLITSIQLYIAAFLAPAFLFVAVSGALFLGGVKGDLRSSAVKITPGHLLDLDSPELQSNVETLLVAAGYSPRIDYIQRRGDTLVTHPASRSYFELRQEAGVLSVTHNAPNFPRTLIGLHTGHGPKVFQLYQKLVAFGLFFVVLSGLWLGIESPSQRTRTLSISILGLLVFCVAAFVA